MRYSEGAWDMTSVLVTALGNQPKAFASDLSDDQSRYLYFIVAAYVHFADVVTQKQ